MRTWLYVTLSLLFVAVVVHRLHDDPVKLLVTATRWYEKLSIFAQPRCEDTSAKMLRDHYDFIVIGSGTAGSVVASRLSENPDWNVLLLEAGRDETLLNDVPLVCGVLQLTEYNWGYSTEPQQHACLGLEDRRCPYPRGKALGGTSSINYMVYIRGNRGDYDELERKGNTGWSYVKVLPHFLRSENIEIPELQDSKYHSRGGYLDVGHIPFRTPLADAFLEAGVQLGFKVTDYNGEQQQGFSYLQVNMRNGTRLSSSKAFLRSQCARNNLHISMASHVTRVVIDPASRQVRGVEFIKRGRQHYVAVVKEVVVSAGTLQSPQVLMLSGIGPKDHLKDMDIDVIVDLPVGHNLRNHAGYMGAVFLVNDTVGLSPPRMNRSPGVLVDYLLHGGGPLTLPGGPEAIAYLRTRFAEDERPDLELLYITGGINTDGGGVTKKNNRITDEIYETVYRPVDYQDSFTIWPIVLRPRSVGRVMLADNHPLTPPLFHPNLLSDPYDVAVAVEGVKLIQRLAATPAFQKYGATLHDVPLPGCTDHVFDGDEYWACAVRHLSATINHQIGTCKMGPASDPSAVVDPELRVRGVVGLRVADASILPDTLAAHTNAPAYMIGEKAANMIRTAWTSTAA